MKENALIDKVALITGGARRIGASIARHLHAAGMQLVIHYRHSDVAAHALQEELNGQRPASVLLLQADLLQVPKLTRMIHDTINHYGRLDVLINNASSFYATPIGQAEENDWEDLLGTNLKAPFFLSQAAAPHLVNTHGCIINLVDIHAERPLKLHPIYSTAKAGLCMLTQSLARDMAPYVRVNAIAPGTILWPADSDLDEVTKQRMISNIPLKRHGEPEEIARVVLFLVRDAGYITGEILTVDGGRTLIQ